MLNLAIISHTEHYLNGLGEIVGWGPTIREVDYLTKIFDNIFHIAPLHQGHAPNSAIKYQSKNVKFIALKPSGGQSIQKLNILFNASHNLRTINSAIRNVDFIQFRGPTGIGLYVLPYLKFFNKKKYWVKYAGNWIADDLPMGNRMQRFWLKHILSNKTKVTVNGYWENDKDNILSFENPSLTEDERSFGKLIVNSKQKKGTVNFCFVGALNRFKGVDIILEALKLIKNKEKLGTIHFVGDGPEMNHFKSIAGGDLNMNIVFHGFMEKDQIIQIYKSCHFIILPSKSEGFPKVIGEGMNFGCVPIVSKISCIDQYIVNGVNGFLIQPNDCSTLAGILNLCMALPNNKFKLMIDQNYSISEKFTYTYFIREIKCQILELC